MLFGIFRHYKGKYYLATGIAKFSEDPTKEFVIYRQLYGNFNTFGQIWARPKDMFMETTRFKLIFGIK